ncbi:MAG: hypothetical protein LBP68_09080 [Acidobacteriota bacterium]|jgi:hypothetical protein|nr:hypothetical protein [Acidobacteriota bacterium]
MSDNYTFGYTQAGQGGFAETAGRLGAPSLPRKIKKPWAIRVAHGLQFPREVLRGQETVVQAARAQLDQLRQYQASFIPSMDFRLMLMFPPRPTHIIAKTLTNTTAPQPTQLFHASFHGEHIEIHLNHGWTRMNTDISPRHHPCLSVFIRGLNHKLFWYLDCHELSASILNNI